MQAAAAILAGGRATRMGGRCKPLLEVEGRPILERQLEVLAPIFAEIAICAGDPAPFAAFGLPVLPDRVPGAGPLAGIASALAWTERRWVFAVAGDMPFLDPRVVELLLDRRGGADLVVPVVGGRLEPLHAVYGRRCLAAIEERLAAGRGKASALATEGKEHGLVVETVDGEKIRNLIPDLEPDFRFLTNVNAPPDLL